MDIKNKLTVQFILRLIIFVFTLIILLAFGLIYIGSNLIKQEMTVDPSLMTSEDIEIYVPIKDGKVTDVSESLKKAIKSKNGWLQVISPKGEVIYAYNTPNDIPTTYQFEDIVRLADNKLFPSYSYNYWVLEKNYIVVNSVDSESSRLLHMLIANGIYNKEELTEEISEIFKRQKAWFQLYNAKGDILETYNPTKRELPFKVIDLLKAEKEPWDYKESIASTTFENGDTLVVGLPNVHYYPNATLEEDVLSSLLISSGKVLLLIALFLVFISFWYGRKYGKPLLHILKWIDNLANKKYVEPVNRKGQALSRKKNGRLKKPYRLFNDVLASLQTLTTVLKQREIERKKIEQTREEWITGLSHDLKTPLSSIMGYALLLESTKYEWNNKEVQKFGKNITEKAKYMTSLINDLNLTYRLKNSTFPIVKKTEKINELVKKTVIDFFNHPQYSEQKIEFIDVDQDIYYEVDAKWFQRIIENILANAIHHNPDGTMLKVRMKQLQGMSQGFSIIIEDNGIGIDEEMKEKLFDRYYRGTSTTADQTGTGLGLAISQQLIKMHGGQIMIESKKNVGTKVILHFPYQIVFKKELKKMNK